LVVSIDFNGLIAAIVETGFFQGFLFLQDAVKLPRIVASFPCVNYSFPE
jgi:hypothetical protein